MLQPRPLPLVVSGAIFTALILGLPLLHLNIRPSGATLVFAIVPTLVLVAMLLAPRRPVLSHFAFPISHLPLLVALPDLAGDRVYSGFSGLVALLAVLGAGAAYIVAATPRLFARRARIEVLGAVGLVLGLAPLLAFTVSALTVDDAPWPALTALVIGPMVAWWLVAHGFARQVALLHQRPSERARAAYILRLQTRPRPALFVAAAVLSVLALSLIAFLYLWSPR